MAEILPVTACLPDLEAALLRHPVVLLSAPTGSGKTTVVPGALLGASWLGDRKIVMLEPRRLAARLACEWMAAARGERAGETVGYRTGQETRVSQATRIEIMTEGVLTRLLQRDPELVDVGLIIFDEVHERHLTTDLGLALVRDVQGSLRPDLRVLLMSATLARDTLVRHFPRAPLIESSGRQFPVDVSYIDRPSAGRLDVQVRAAVHVLYGKAHGDILVFLPGMRDILQCEKALLQDAQATGFVLCRLHGSMSRAEQDQVLVKMATRRVILATAVAQSSVTLPSVDAVVDAGLMRVARFDQGSGFTRLMTVPASQDVAEQRAGRAGRVRAGYCLRLWTETDHGGRPRFATPEIEQADLSGLVLDLAAWGTADGAALSWLTTPPSAGLAGGRRLLSDLGLITPRGELTPAGRLAADTGFPPRLAATLFRADAAQRPLVCAVTALLGERDPVREREDCSLSARLMWLRDHPSGPLGDRLRQCLRRTRAVVWQGEYGADEDALAMLLMYAYQDRIAMRVDSKEATFKLASGQRASIFAGDPLSRAKVLIALVVEETSDDVWIRLATPIPPETWVRVAKLLARDRILVRWDERAHSFSAQRERFLGEILLQTVPVPLPPVTDLSGPLKAAVLRYGLEALPWTEEALTLRVRLMRVREWFPEQEWPDVTDPALLDALDLWVDPALHQLAPGASVGSLDIAYGLRQGLLTQAQRLTVDRLAPMALPLRSGRLRPLRYPESGPPVLAAPIQEFLGLREIPRIAGGRVTPVAELLSPARRPLQITSDLTRFWQTMYPEIRRSLAARYPRHDWPLDPLNPPPPRARKPR